jgi:hypothetical protein
MLDPYSLAFLRIPASALTALDSRAYHFALQPYHYLVRAAHLVSTAAFFGGIGLLDLRLIGLRGTVPLKYFAEHTLPWLHATFGIAAASGIALFLYDPVHVGSHAYFTPKLLLLAFGLANAALFHRAGYVAALTSEARLPVSARVAGAASLLLWTGVMLCAALNGEGAPKVVLR